MRGISVLAFLNLRVLLGLVALATGVFLSWLTGANAQALIHKNSHDRNRAPVAPYGGVQETWVARFNGPGNGDDATTAIAVDKEGNVYVTGFSLSTALPDYDYVTIKYDSAGQEQWVRTYGGTGNDTAVAIAVDDSGNVYVTGSVLDAESDYDYVTIKYNSAGDEQWVAPYNGPGNGSDSAKAIVVDKSGNVYLTGTSHASANDIDYATIKYDSAGQEQWVARYNGPGDSDDDAFALTIDGLGNVYVTGGSTGGAISPDYATVKYNSAGQEQWVARHDGFGNYDYATDIVVDDSGNVFVTGDSIGSNGLFDYLTIRYDAAGQEQWTTRYEGTGNGDNFAVALGIDDSGNVYVTGQSPGAKNYDAATLKYDSAGQEQWVARYDGGFDDYANALAVDNSGSVYVTGSTVSPDPDFNFNFATIKYNPLGQEEWVTTYDGPVNLDDSAAAITVDDSGNVYVTGGSTGSESGADYATVKYIQGVTPTPTPTATPRPTPTPRPRPTPAPRPTP
jgi:Beta-propeller repeat